MMSRMEQPAAVTTARMLSSDCLVWEAMSGPATRPVASAPVCPATTSSSPPLASIPWEYIPAGFPNSFGSITLIVIAPSLETDL